MKKNLKLRKNNYLNNFFVIELYLTVTSYHFFKSASIFITQNWGIFTKLVSSDSKKISNEKRINITKIIIFRKLFS